MSAEPAQGCIYLIDAYSLIFQVFHAIPLMSSPSGLPTNALFGFTRDLLYLRLEKKPDYLVCTLDAPGPTFRDKLYPEYKANRTAMPPELVAQMPLIRELLDAFRIPRLEVEGVEADDLLATVATAGAQRGLDVFLCTSDKDCRQLLNDRVRLYNLRKQSIFDQAALLEDWGVAPDQVVDLQALVGDPVDNVPGVPGIGIKTAAKLLQQFGTLDKLLAAVEVPVKKPPVGPKTWENLRKSIPIVKTSRELVRLKTDVPIDLDWDGWRLGDWNRDRLLELFGQFGFRGFAAQVRGQADASAATEDDLFPFGANVAPAETAAAASEPHTYHLVDTQEKFAEFLGKLRQQTRISFDSETTSLEPLRADIVGLAFAWEKGEAWYLALRGPEGAATLDPDATLTALRPILTNPAVTKINQNVKYDLLVLRAHGIHAAGIAGDPMVADYLLHAGERSHNIADLANRYLKHQVIPITDLIGKGRNQLRMDQVPTERVAEYSGEDADIALQLCNLLEAKLREENLRPLYDDVEVPLIDVLTEIEYHGIRLDVPLLERLSVEMAEQLAALEKTIHQLAGREFNIASPKQLRTVLFDELKLPTQKKTGVTGEASTDQETLERLAAFGHELPRKLIEHRQIAKLKGTYVDALPGLVHPRTGRLHASFNQTVAATGRLSSSDPNLQNIPVRTEQGRQIRQAFLPEEGWVLLTADYSQIELRLLAHFCGDENLRQAFAEERDIHAAVAAQIFGVHESLVSSEQRRMAKTVNFGVIYGMSAHGLAQRLGIARDEAHRFIEAYFARYPRVLEYQDRLLENCRRTGYVSTILGRRRQITGIRPKSNWQQRIQPEREAVNMEIQGSAADLIKLAMLGIQRRLWREQRTARMLLQIHDELVFETRPEDLAELAALVQEEMTTPLEQRLGLQIPLRVDQAAGPNWLDVEDLEASAAPGGSR